MMVKMMTGLLDAAEAYIGDPYNGILRRPVRMTEFSEEFANLSEVCIEFPDGATVTSVTYIEAVGTEQTLASGYSLVNGCIVGSEWPGPPISGHGQLHGGLSHGARVYRVCGVLLRWNVI